MSASAAFEVLVTSSGSNLEEWQRALKASRADLHLQDLTEEQKQVAGRFGISVEDYARGILAFRYGRERRENEGRALGRHVAELLDGLGEGYNLLSVIWESDRLRWMLRIKTPTQVVGVPVSFELAEDVIVSGVLAEMERLRLVLWEGVGRNDLASRRSGG